MHFGFSSFPVNLRFTVCALHEVLLIKVLGSWAKSIKQLIAGHFGLIPRPPSAAYQTVSYGFIYFYLQLICFCMYIVLGVVWEVHSLLVVSVYWSVIAYSVPVCSTSGDGKTHYIRKKMKSSRGQQLTVAINESFSAVSVIQQLRSLPVASNNVLYFSFTLLPPSVSLLHASPLCRPV